LQQAVQAAVVWFASGSGAVKAPLQVISRHVGAVGGGMAGHGAIGKAVRQRYSKGGGVPEIGSIKKTILDLNSRSQWQYTNLNAGQSSAHSHDFVIAACAAMTA
jgi:hypothetical protein